MLFLFFASLSTSARQNDFDAVHDMMLSDNVDGDFFLELQAMAPCTLSVCKPACKTASEGSAISSIKMPTVVKPGKDGVLLCSLDHDCVSANNRCLASIKSQNAAAHAKLTAAITEYGNSQNGAALTKPAAGAITHAAPEMPQQGAALASRHVNTIPAADSSSLLPFPDQPQIPTSTGMPQIPAGTGMPQIPVGVDCIAKSKMCLAAMSNLLQHLTVHPVKSVMEDDHIIGALDASKDKQVYCKFTEKFQFCKEKQLMMPTWAQTRDDQNMLCAALNAQIACMGNCANQCLQGKFKSWCTGQTVAKTTTIGLDADLQALLNDDIDLNDLLPAQHDPYCEL
jgi:hypothetical protein